MEGKGPRERVGPNREKANQAEEVESITDSLNNLTFMAGGHTPSSKDLWYLDSSTTSHICNNRQAYTDFIETGPVPIRGISSPAISTGYRMVEINFRIKDKTITSKIQNVLFLAKAPNCLISVSRFNEKGGRVIFHKGECFLKRQIGYRTRTHARPIVFIRGYRYKIH